MCSTSNYVFDVMCTLVCLSFHDGNVDADDDDDDEDEEECSLG